MTEPNKDKRLARYSKREGKVERPWDQALCIAAMYKVNSYIFQ